MSGIQWFAFVILPPMLVLAGGSVFAWLAGALSGERPGWSGAGSPP